MCSIQLKKQIYHFLKEATFKNQNKHCCSQPLNLPRRRKKRLGWTFVVLLVLQNELRHRVKVCKLKLYLCRILTQRLLSETFYSTRNFSTVDLKSKKQQKSQTWLVEMEKKRSFVILWLTSATCVALHKLQACAKQSIFETKSVNHGLKRSEMMQEIAGLSTIKQSSSLKSCNLLLQQRAEHYGEAISETGAYFERCT